MENYTPFSKEYEQQFLGCIIVDNKLMEQAMQLKVDDLDEESHRKIFLSMLELHGKAPINEVTLGEHLKKKGQLEEVGGFSCLGNLRTLLLTSANISFYIEKIKEAALRRRVKENAQRIIQGIEKDCPLEEIEKLQERILTDQLNGRRAIQKEIPWPAPLADDAYYGLAGEFVKTVKPHSEADPVALLMNFLASFGNIIGDKAHFRVEADKHPMRLFVVLVGPTAKGRKGTSCGYARNIFGAIDPDWAKNIQKGLSSGEGLIWAVRNEIKKKQPIREKGRIVGYEDVMIDEGVADKKLLIIEEEFASTLRVLGRDGNVLSAVIRSAWDTGDLQTLTKNSPAKATGAHISIIGHITQQELLRYLTDIESGNGFGNRFLWVCVKRSKFLPFGGDFFKLDVAPLIRRIKEATLFVLNELNVPLLWAEKTRPIWEKIYPELSEGKPGLIGALTARAEAYVTRLACIYALLDHSPEIRPNHLKAAVAVWDYVVGSVRYIFQNATGDALAEDIAAILASRPEGMTRTEIYKHFSHHKTSEQIEAALGLLYSLGRVQKTIITTEGRPKEVWTLSQEEDAQKAQNAQ